MIIWIDAQLSAALAFWLRENYGVEVTHVRDLGHRDASDEEIFQAARMKNAILMSKDSDFLNLIDSYGSPPKILWITCGNTSNEALTKILSTTLDKALKLLEDGESIVEITSRS